VKIKDKIIYDPDSNEENAADARFSVSIRADGNITAMQKGVGGSFSFEELEKMIAFAKKEYKRIIKYIG
jgi:exosome complex component RRP42